MLKSIMLANNYQTNYIENNWRKQLDDDNDNTIRTNILVEKNKII